ncbi:MAG TPA: prepilin-type N-terminal cleavage/methylation domain-containing protein [Planctomycetota bacterium]|nr:prepilin-type N-terminal cleavage/methylation domain-containing protein [Planctomycetota bacterium]
MNRRGFTLLELLVALIIFATVIAAAYSLFDTSRSLVTRAEFRSQLFQTARTALQAIEDDVRGSTMSGSAFDAGFIGLSGGSDKEPTAQLQVISVNRYTGGSRDVNAPPPVFGIDLAMVRYWIEPDKSKPAFGLVRDRPLELTPLNGPVQRDEDIVEIARDVAYLNFRYYDGTQWLPTWDSTQSGTLPQAVEVTIYVRGEWRDQEVLEPFISRFYLAVGAQTPQKQQ